MMMVKVALLVLSTQQLKYTCSSGALFIPSTTSLLQTWQDTTTFFKLNTKQNFLYKDRKQLVVVLPLGKEMS